MPNPRDPQYWRERAKAARDTAKTFKTRGAIQQMLEIANGYDRLAKMAEDLEKIPDKKP